ncbi:TRAP transporter small permease [Paralcaligenes ginsengisoli]
MCRPLSITRRCIDPASLQDIAVPIIRFLDRTLFRLISILTQLLILSAVAAGFYQVIARFVLQAPADWSEAWTRASLIWMVLLGIVLAFRGGAMLSVEMLHSVLAGRKKRWLEHLLMLISVGFLVFMAWVGSEMTWRVRFQNVPSLNISISWIYLAIPVGTALAALAVIVRWAEGPSEAVSDEAPV